MADMVYKIIIAGGRDFDDYDMLKSEMDTYLFKDRELSYLMSGWPDEVEIVSGCAKGADKLGERYGISNGYLIKRFPADWDKHGRGAGHIRNREMAEYAGTCVVFWDGKSRGSKNMIDTARELSLDTHVVSY